MSGTAALILAGGAGRRLGGADKPLLLLDGRPILARILDTLSRDISDIAISANGDPARFATFARPVLADGVFAGQVPLAGLLAGLDWAFSIGAETLLSVPGDTPFIPGHLAAALAPAPSIATSGGRAHHLVGLWPVAIRVTLRTRLVGPFSPTPFSQAPFSQTGSRRAQDFANAIGARRVDFPVQPWDRFMNVNTAEDLAAARHIARMTA